MLYENNLFMTLIVEVAGNFSMKIRKIGKKWALELGGGWKISYKLNVNVHKDLNLTLNDQIYD